MSATAYDKGDLIRVTGEFRNLAGTLIDPTAVAFSFRIANGAITTYTYPTTIVKDSVGSYHVDIDTSAASGTYLFRWVSTGTGQGAEEGYFEVANSNF